MGIFVRPEHDDEGRREENRSKKETSDQLISVISK
jgi:hypothetical protein